MPKFTLKRLKRGKARFHEESEKYDSEDVRLQINNIKRADYRKTWKVKDRKKKKASATISKVSPAPNSKASATVSKVSPVPTKAALKDIQMKLMKVLQNSKKIFSAMQFKIRA